ncbi:hypothetical protein BpHYR1_000905 [Brachionus plicatilis]|uniref:Uncharacterized protein n=1 Tax=Brachionus plicatilis TaxID=10195 RepID=A0A3M7SFA3_BRAPC|nr:hypothetical protein BpHYR1_000905 [Brachionus plicatilis]
MNNYCFDNSSDLDPNFFSNGILIKIISIQQIEKFSDFFSYKIIEKDIKIFSCGHLIKEINI